MINDNMLGPVIDECRLTLHRLSTQDALTLSYNLLIGKFRLACLCGEREEMLRVARDIYDGLLDEIEEFGER